MIKKTLVNFFMVHFGLLYLSAGFIFGLLALAFALAAVGGLSLDCLNVCLFCTIACALEFATAYFLMQGRIEKKLPHIGSHCMVALLTIGFIFGWIVSS